MMIWRRTQILQEIALPGLSKGKTIYGAIFSRTISSRLLRG